MRFPLHRGTWSPGVLLVSVVTSLLASPLTAQPTVATDIRDHRVLRPQRFSIRLGLLLNDHDTAARVDSELLGPGTKVDVERDLGLDATTRDFRADAALRIGRRHELQLGYLFLSRTGSTSLRSSIQWGDFIFPVDVEVESSIDVELLPVSYRYSMILTDRLDVGLSVGVFAMFLDAGVSAPEADVVERESAEFPLPVIGGEGMLSVAPGLRLTGSAKYFAVEIRDVQGSWREIRGAVEFFPWRRLGVGIGYRSIRLEADGSEGLFTRPEGTLLLLDYRFSGPHLYLTIAP